MPEFPWCHPDPRTPASPSTCLPRLQSLGGLRPAPGVLVAVADVGVVVSVTGMMVMVVGAVLRGGAAVTVMGVYVALGAAVVGPVGVVEVWWSAVEEKAVRATAVVAAEGLAKWVGRLGGKS